ncbi:MAG: DNA repair and recombination protein RadA [Candidatus Hodarchaeales archaeon]|jgi:DNA repair protein RadA
MAESLELDDLDLELEEIEVEKVASSKKAKKIESVKDLPGVGPSTAKKLSEAGFESLMSIAAASIAELTAIASLGEKTALKMIETARRTLDLSFVPATEILESRKNMLKITTGAQSLDVLLGGGIETGAMTEIYGEFRTGKTQIAHQLCVTIQLPQSEGGLHEEGEDAPKVKAVYLDSEGTFRPERIIAMAQNYPSLDPQEVLANILVGRCYNSDHQIALADKVAKDSQTDNIKLLVVDSIISHFRAEYIGRGTLANRQQKLNAHIHTLLRVAEVSKLAVLAINQVHAKPDTFFGDPTAPVGGHVVAHAAQTRIMLRKSKGNRRIARIADSPLLPESEGVFQIHENGIIDP